MGKSILITGCSSGIGHDAAHALTARGWQVFAACRKQEDCDRLKEQGLRSPRIDHADPESIAAGLETVLEETGGRLDALFNNAAFGLPALIEDTPRAAMEEIFHANFFGVHDLTVRAVKVMRAQGHGRIVMNSSVLGLVAVPFRGPYSATKFALEAMSDALRRELMGTGIHVSIIEPGPITSAFRVNTIPPYKRWISPGTSARRDAYRDQIEARMYREGGRDPGERPASAVTAKLIHALEARRPRARYRVTWPTHVMAALDWLLPTWAKDRILRLR